MSKKCTIILAVICTFLINCTEQNSTQWKRISLSGIIALPFIIEDKTIIDVTGDLTFVINSDSVLYIEGDAEFRVAEDVTVNLPKIISKSDDAFVEFSAASELPWKSISYDHSDGSIEFNNIKISNAIIGIEVKSANYVYIDNVQMDRITQFGIYLSEVNNVIVNDVLIKNTTTGINLESSADTVRITDLTIKDCEYGVYNNLSSVFINQSLMERCSAAAIYTRSEGYFELSKSTFRDNAIHVYQQNNRNMNISLCEFNNAENVMLYIVSAMNGRHSIANNNFSTSNTRFVTIQAGTINMGDNYWGTTNTEIIDQKIVDFNDYSDMGNVSYLPIRMIGVEDAGKD